MDQEIQLVTYNLVDSSNLLNEVFSGTCDLKLDWDFEIAIVQSYRTVVLH
jgi:hypothetical protein